MRFSAKELHVICTLGFCGLVSAADNWFVSPALPSIAQTLAVLPSAAAIVLTAYLVPYGALQPVCGSLGDSFGRLRLLRIIVLGLAVGTFACALVPSLGALVAARVLTGCFAAGIISVSQAFVGDTVGQSRRAGAVGILMGITFTGQGLSAGLGGILTDLVGWRAAFASFGVLALVAWAGLWFLREPVRQQASGAPVAVNAESGRTASPSGADGAVSAKADAAGAHGAACADAARRRGAEGDAGGTGTAVIGFFRDAVRVFFGRGRAVFLLACTTGILFLGVYGLMGTFLSERCGLTATQSGLIMMLYGVFCLVGGALSGSLGTRCGLSAVIAVGEVSGACAALALFAVAVTGLWEPALVAAACLGLGYILVQPTLVSLSMDADPSQAGLCTGLVGFGVFAGGGVGSTLGGAFLGIAGYPALWVVAAALLILQLVASTRVLRR